MSYDSALADWVVEALTPVGGISVRRMFGGAGLYCDGTIFALVARDDLWFKSDAVADPAWDALAAERFRYDFADGRTGVMNYRRAPADAHDDPEALRGYAALALEAGRRRTMSESARASRAKSRPNRFPEG